MAIIEEDVNTRLNSYTQDCVTNFINVVDAVQHSHHFYLSESQLLLFSCMLVHGAEFNDMSNMSQWSSIKWLPYTYGSLSDRLRLSRPGCLVLRRGGLPINRRSPT